MTRAKITISSPNRLFDHSRPRFTFDLAPPRDGIGLCPLRRVTTVAHASAYPYPLGERPESTRAVHRAHRNLKRGRQRRLDGTVGHVAEDRWGHAWPATWMNYRAHGHVGSFWKMSLNISGVGAVTAWLVRLTMMKNQDYMGKCNVVRLWFCNLQISFSTF